MNVLVIGASGGIGSAIVDVLLQRYPEATIYATYHQHPPADQKHERVHWFLLDVTNAEEIEILSQQFDTLDWLINCVGMLHSSMGPEKSLQAVDAYFFQHNIAVNTLPTLLLAKYFTPILKLSSQPKFAVLSARVGSITDNQLGGWYSYRASKAALNMIIKTMSIEWRRSVKKGTVLALHPGTTDTELSKPFQHNVPEGKLFPTGKVAKMLIDIIERSTDIQSGAFMSYDGQILEW
ncbi:SDR family oxidoreductase [Vibrio viridaestus]|uniref:SDR family oxidoreductase n=1 Tax=Vibrio viridaestus TaxID=2487322 RepID=A0A3N9TGM0_9VIBR|nr:SDR family oxidoreductase [Vibrio viridaestus]RQW63150.1 SDR family oxidoreductase [Vibrio viridaestus]